MLLTSGMAETGEIVTLTGDEHRPTTDGERNRVAGSNQANEHAGGAGPGGAVDFQADGAGASIDQRHLASGVVEIGILRRPG